MKKSETKKTIKPKSTTIVKSSKKLNPEKKSETKKTIKPKSTTIVKSSKKLNPEKKSETKKTIKPKSTTTAKSSKKLNPEKKLETKKTIKPKSTTTAKSSKKLNPEKKLETKKTSITKVSPQSEDFQKKETTQTIVKPIKLNKVVRVNKISKIVKIKKKVQTTSQTNSPTFSSELFFTKDLMPIASPPSSTCEYDKEKLKRALTDNLIPIKISPLKVTLKKTSPEKKEDEEDQIAVSTVIKSSLSKVWKLWTSPTHIKKWFTASEDWHTTEVKNKLKVGEDFFFTMKSKDGKEISEFKGVYTEIFNQSLIVYITNDNRKVFVSMELLSSAEIKLTQSFEPDYVNSIDIQYQGWQAILDSFKNYVESNK